MKHTTTETQTNLENMKSPVTTSSRRNFFKVAIGAAGSLAAIPGFTQVCGMITGKQPIGPFFPNEGTPEDPIREGQDPTTPIYLANDNDLTVVRGRVGQAQGQVIQIVGQVRDSNCQPITGANLIIWQASSSGRYNHKGDQENHDFIHPKTGVVIKRSHDPFFQYWGRTVTDTNGAYKFKTIIPGFYPADLNTGWYRPPHIHFMVSATGHHQLVTQLYFRGDSIVDNDFIQELNQKDPLLQDKNLSREQRQALIVDFKNSPDNDCLVGSFNMQL